MKITRIKALCKAANRARIYTDGRRQYLGTLEAAYPADNIEIGKASIPTLFDMPDALSDLTVDEVQLRQSDMMPDEALDGVPFRREGQLTEMVAITYLDEQIVAMTADDARVILFVRAETIRAAEKTEGYQLFHRAANRCGEPLVILSDGMMVTGIVRPIPQRTAQSILTLMRGMVDMIPVGSPDPGEIREETGEQLPGQMHIEDMMEDDHADE